MGTRVGGLATVVAVSVAIVTTAAPARAASTWSGTWNTQWGGPPTVVTLVQSGAAVTGTYTYDNGQIQGTIAGGVLRGTWTETPTRAGPTDAGEFEWTLSAGGRSFTGRWRYAGGGSWASWSGTCSTGACAANDAATATTTAVPTRPTSTIAPATTSTTEVLTPVPIEAVSNGCGGAGWASLVKVQNYLGNTSTYKDSNTNPLAKSYTVNFKSACDLHDAGYGGAIVKDALRGDIKDFRKWTRKQVDDKFLADMRLLCERQIPATAIVALANCKARGGNLSFGAESRYNFVRKFGNLFFDADLKTAGNQRSGTRSNS